MIFCRKLKVHKILTMITMLWVFLPFSYSQSQESTQKLQVAISALKEIPQWDFSDAKVSVLSGGLTNLIFKVESPRYGNLVLRLAGSEAESLGVQSEHQAHHSILAGKLTVSPQVVFFDPSKKLMLIDFFEGHTLKKEDYSKQKVFSNLVSKIKKIHRGTKFIHPFNPFTSAKTYLKQARDNGKVESEVIDEFTKAEALLETIEQAVKQVYQDHESSCHNDLHAGNILVGEKDLFLIDWDYSGRSDAFYDLAILSNSLNLSEQEDQALLQEYLGKEKVSEVVSEKDLAHLQLMRMVSDMWNASWYFSQIGVSKIGEANDFGKNALSSLNKFLDKTKSEQFNQWLGKVH